MSLGESPRVLKAHAAQGLGSRVAFNFEDLRQQCHEYLAQTRAQAEQLLADAAAQAHVLREQTLMQARAEGYQTGLRDAEEVVATRAHQMAEQRTTQQLASALPALQQAAVQLHAERDRWLRFWETSAVSVGIAIAERLVRSELARRPELMPQRVAELLQLAAGSPRLRLRMHPRDVAVLEEHGQNLLNQLAPAGRAELLADESVSPGGCIIETEHGVIDGRLETQLDRMRQELLEV